MEEIFWAIRGETEPTKMLTQAKFFTIQTLNQVLAGLVRSLASDTEKTTQSLQIIMQATIALLQNAKLSKEDDSAVMNEFLTEFFASIVEQVAKFDSNLIRPYRKDVLELFNVDTFFQMSMRNLKQWRKIMKYFIDGKPDEMFDE